MKKKHRFLKYIVVFLLLLIAAALALTHIPASGEVSVITRSIYASGAVRQIEKDVDFTGEDIFLLSNGSLVSLEIKSHETAEFLYHCIRNAERIFDVTHVCLLPEPLPISAGESSGDFTHIYCGFPLTGRIIKFCFSEEDAAAFEEYVMAAVKENTKEERVG